MKTQAALAAAMIRKEIKSKFPCLKFTCRSENFSGGDAIRVGVIEDFPEIEEEIRHITKKYVYGKFDSMTDFYDITNRRDDIPQVRYLIVSTDY